MIGLTDVESKSKLKSFFDDQAIFKSDYDEYSLSLENELQTLVPNELFNNSTAKDLFKFNFGGQGSDIDFNRIPELGMVSIFDFPLWIKSLFVINFPHVSLFHKSVVDLKGIFNLPTFNERTYLMREHDALTIYRVQEGKLQFFNRFKCLNWEDLTYFTLLVLNNEKASPKNEIILCDFEDQIEVDKLSEFVNKNLGEIKEASRIDSFSLINQRLCV